MNKIFLNVLLFISLFIVGQTVDAAEIHGNVKFLPNETAREYVHRVDGTTKSSQFNWFATSNFDAIKIRVVNEQGQVVFDGVTGTNGLDAGEFRVTSLPVGTYTVTILNEEYSALPFSLNELINPTQYPLKPKETTVVLNSETDKINLYWILVNKSRKVISVSKRGVYPGGTAGNDQHGTPINYRVWYVGGDTVPTINYNGRKYINFYGALNQDTLGMYSSVTTIPNLTADEQTYGWEFKGWRINGSHKIYSPEEVVQYIIKENITLEAVWEAPNYEVVFATDSEKGSIEGESVKKFLVEGNASNIATITNNQLPKVTPKAGYTFVGWYVDHTTNIVNEPDILNESIRTNMIYFAKYKKNTPDITIGSNGNWYIDGVDTGKTSIGQTGAAGQDGTSITIQKTEENSDGNIEVTFSDGTMITVINGKDGKDGKDAVVTIGQNGNWYINGVDTGKTAKGQDGKDGTSITIQKTEKNVDGNIEVTFSDGTTIVLINGKDGQNGKNTEVIIGDNGNWIVDGVDTGISAHGNHSENAINDTSKAKYTTGQLPYTGQNITLVVTTIGALLGMLGMYTLGRQHRRSNK